MKAISDWLWWWMGTPVCTWISIILIVLSLFLVLMFWSCCVLACRSDDQSERLFQKMMEERGETNNIKSQ